MGLGFVVACLQLSPDFISYSETDDEDIKLMTVIVIWKVTAALQW